MNDSDVTHKTVDKQDSSGATAEDYELAAADVLWQVVMRDFDRLPMYVLVLILRESFGRRRPKAYLPRLSLFAAFTAVSKGNVSIALRWLKEHRVIEEWPAGWYGINITFLDWDVPHRVDSSWIHEQLDLLAGAETPRLVDVLREGFVESRTRRLRQKADLPRREQAAAALLQSPERPEAAQDVAQAPKAGYAPSAVMGVPTSGCGRAEHKSQPSLARWGHLPQGQGGMQARETPGRGPGVPESGTVGASSATKAGKNATSVPESGTVETLTEAKRAAGFEKSVPESGTVGVVEGVPESGTVGSSPPTTPLSKAINEERLNVKRLTIKRSTLDAQEGQEEQGITEEAWLMGQLVEWLGEPEMEANGGMWRACFVRRHAERVEEFLGWGKYLEAANHPDKPRHRAKWLMSKLMIATRKRASAGL